MLLFSLALLFLKISITLFFSNLSRFFVQSMGASACAENIEDIQLQVSQPSAINFSVFNSRSLRNKVTQVVELLIDQRTDVCCVSETWLRKGDSAIVNEINERGFNVSHVP